MSNSLKNKYEPQDLVELNQSEFLRQNEWLERYYSQYSNSVKILVLLEFWIYSFRSVLEQYGLEGAKKFCFDPKTLSSIEFSWLIEYDVDIRAGIRPTFSKSLFYILSRFLRKYSGPGAPIINIFDKLRWRLSRLILLSSPIIYTEKRKSDLIEELLKTFDWIQKDEIRDCLNKGLPKVFYANQNPIEISKKSNISIEISPEAILNCRGQENILLFDKYVTLIGRQHGGGYGSYVNEYAEKLEIDLSDEFIGWGLLKENRPQHRYKKDRSKINHLKYNRIVWVETARFPKLYKYFYPHTYNQAIDKKSIIAIFSALKDSNTTYYNLKHNDKSLCPLYDKYRGLKLFNSGLGEKSLNKNDVIIFDSFYASLIFYCVKNNNIFICVTTHEDVLNFTESNLEWFNLLHKNGLAFYNDDSEALRNRFKEITDSNFVIPKEVTNYHYKKFISI